MNNADAGLYIHIPFCRQKCNYCDFYSVCVSDSLTADFTKRLITDIREQAAEYSGTRFDTMFVGGGTPSVLGSRLVEIIACTLNSFNFSAEGEISVEVNPESADLNLLRALKYTGVNRISVGAQSFDNELLKMLGRVHDRDKIYLTIDNILSAGFTNYNLDIMFGLPKLADSSIDLKSAFEDTIERLKEICPPHISAYSLTVNEGTSLWRNIDKYTFFNEEEEEELYHCLCSELALMGYSHYEISNFAKEGYECRHNLKYWTGQPYIGIGPAAHSYVNCVRYSMPNDVDEYCIGNAERTILEYISDKETAYERLIFGLRTKRGVDFSELTEFYDINMLKKCIADLAKCNYINATLQGFALTEQGFRVSNRIIGLLSDCIK